MAAKQFDPQKFIDREFEQELFEELLQLKDPARILAIKDDGGMGKAKPSASIPTTLPPFTIAASRMLL